MPLWQEDLWKLIIAAAESEEPDFVDVMQLKNAHFPAASRYAATTPKLLDWFDGYNREHPKARVFPFNFLLSLQIKSEIEMARFDLDFRTDALWKRREPKPTAPYFKDIRKAAKKAFDRELPGILPTTWLKSHGRSLVRYHMHEEAKFVGAQYDQYLSSVSSVCRFIGTDKVVAHRVTKFGRKRSVRFRASSPLRRPWFVTNA